MSRTKSVRPGMKTIVKLLVIMSMFVESALAEAQQTGKVYRIGYLSPVTLSSDSTDIEAFRQGLRDLGYVEGKNVLIEYRFAEGKPDRLPDLVTELLRLKVDVIFARGTSGVQAAKKATTTVPLVTVSGDPEAAGFVASLARPGGNITGLTNFTSELGGNWRRRTSFPRCTMIATLPRLADS